MAKRKDISWSPEPVWHRDAIIYQLHVKSFYDANGDGMGDFKGLTQKLDYLEDLGITAIWILPFYPSPLKDDGYDIADYLNIHHIYGDMRDFRKFLSEAHKRDIRVITELVLNHTSDQHPWFQRARRARPGSLWRDFYVWSDTGEKYSDARIIFKDFESSNWTWDPLAKAYYWHRFYSHQPDLNFENSHVREVLVKVIEKWFDMGVDGLRLDAVPYLFEREGTNCENLPETYQFLKGLRAHVDAKYTDRVFIAEANQWPEDAVEYFGDGDCCHMAFHFPLMPRIFMASWTEDRFPILDIMDQTPPIPESCQWALFLRNHDELTLEMVTDEERDYMYKVYAKDPVARINLGIRRRLAPLLENHRRKMELMNVLLFSLPGTPVIYYGDEIGMGDNYYLGDRNGVRTPMQWSADRNAGFSRANPQKLFLPVIIDPEYNYEAVNVENQERNNTSLLWWVKRALSMRKRFWAFGRGELEFLYPENPKILAFLRRYGEEVILVAVNLSRFPQVAELDLSEFAGYYPEELFGNSRFPTIKTEPYIITFGSHDYYWFQLKKEAEVMSIEEVDIPEIRVREEWTKVFAMGDLKEMLAEEVLPGYLQNCRWFGGKARKIREINITEVIPFGKKPDITYLVFVRVTYTEAEQETYALALSFSSGEEAVRVKEKSPQGVISYLTAGDREGVVYDGVFNSAFRAELLRMILRRLGYRGSTGKVVAYPGTFLRKLGAKALDLDSQVLKAEQSNTSILYGTELILKLYRRIEEGMNPDMEIVSFLSEKARFPSIASFAGVVEYRQPFTETVVLGLLQAFVPNQGDAWTYAQGMVGGYLERALSRKEDFAKIEVPLEGLLDAAQTEPPQLFYELAGGGFMEMVILLGKKTAEMHLALSSRPDAPDFAPEPFSMLYQRSLYQSMQNLAKKVFGSLRKNMKRLPEELRDEARELLNKEKEVITAFDSLLKGKLQAIKTRVHGDYHLGQVLYTGNDFIIIDFEGEPARALTERRLKRSPLRDVAAMMRSFQYAAYSPLLEQSGSKDLAPYADLWYRYVEAAFLKSYLQAMEKSPLIPRDPNKLERLLKNYLLEKAVYELGYELNNRPGWVVIPLKGIKNLL